MVKRLRTLLYAFFIVVAASSALAANMTLDELINSYDYNFSDGTINVTAFDDYMRDDDGNGVNDTLVVNVTTNVSGSATYLFIVSLSEDADSIKNYSNKTVSSADQSADVIFDSKLLSLNRYNYSVEIRGQDYSLIYVGDKIRSDNYAGYEQGTSIIFISDQNAGNDFIVLTLNLNVTENRTANITAYLEYNNKSISATQEENLTTPSQLVNISFDNETVKLTHYSGIYSLESVKIGDKIIDTDYNTSSYNYKDFAKSSYITNIASGTFDNNSNNLSDAYQFNFTVNVTAENNYTVEAAVYDSSDNYLTTIAKNETLSTGIQTVVTEISGKDIYSAYYNGKFTLSFARLSIGNQTQDIIHDAHTTNTSFYTDFERPMLPDLTIAMNLNFSETTNMTNAMINITNLGEAPAFNIVVDIFDNNTYENQSSIDYLAVNESESFVFLASNTSEDSLFVAIVDFDNFVDESNESNNIADNYIPLISLNVPELYEIYSAGTYSIFKFVIENNGTTAVNNVTWTLDLGDGTTINSIYNTSLASGETMYVYADHDYGIEGVYNVTATATALADNINTLSTLQIGGSTLSLTDLAEIYSNVSERVFEFVVTSNATGNVSVNWTTDFGDGNVVSSDVDANLSANEQSFVYVQHEYASQGEYTVTATARDGTNTASSSISASVLDVDVSDLAVINVSDTARTFEFMVTNLRSDNLSDASWGFDTGNGFKFNSSVNVTLVPDEYFYVFIDYGYGTTGGFTVNASARNNLVSDYEVLNVTIS